MKELEGKGDREKVVKRGERLRGRWDGRLWEKRMGWEIMGEENWKHM